MFQRIKLFLEDVRAEFIKVQWPTRQATLKSTSVVVSVSIVIAIFLGVADMGLAELMKFIITH